MRFLLFLCDHTSKYWANSLQLYFSDLMEHRCLLARKLNLNFEVGLHLKVPRERSKVKEKWLLLKSSHLHKDLKEWERRKYKQLTFQTSKNKKNVPFLTFHPHRWSHLNKSNQLFIWFSLHQWKPIWIITLGYVT